MPGPPVEIGLAGVLGRVGGGGPDGDLGPHLYCVPCNVRWRGDDVCLSCSGPGVLSELTAPPGWPRLHVTQEMAPGAAA